MTQENAKRGTAIGQAANLAIGAPIGGAVGSMFGNSRKHHTQMQSGYDFGQTDPNDIALLLGTQGYTPSYDSNTKGSFESGFNNVLNRLSPDQLLRRYQKGNASMYQTNMDQQNANAYNSLKSAIGRDPTANELSQALPVFQQGNQSLANAWLSNFAEQLRQNPANNIDQAGKYADQLNMVFKSMLGRDATQDEINHFGSIMATGNLDMYGVQQYLTGTPEYQKAQDTQFRNDLSSQLQNTDLNFFNRAKQGVISQFMQNGTGNSSALDSALTDLMGQISNQRDQYLAGLSAQQYAGNKDLALGNYANTQNQFLNNMNQNRAQSINNQNMLFGRANEMSDYSRQMNDYMNFYNQQAPSNGLNNLNTLLNGINAGANTYRAWK